MRAKEGSHTARAMCVQWRFFEQRNEGKVVRTAFTMPFVAA